MYRYALFSFVVIMACLSTEARHAGHHQNVDMEEPHGRELQRDRRQISWNGVIGTAGCSPKVLAAAQECNKELEEKLKGREQMDGPDLQCCRFAEFRRCVEWEANKECGKDPAETVNSIIRAVQGSLSSRCDEFTYYSPTCIYYIWFNYIVLGGIVLFILAVGCCLGACCCR